MAALVNLDIGQGFPGGIEKEDAWQVATVFEESPLRGGVGIVRLEHDEVLTQPLEEGETRGGNIQSWPSYCF